MEENKAIERTVTLEEAAKLPNMLGVFAVATLRARGWYGYTTIDGKKHMLILAK